jgi:hypothetical protein
LLPPCCKHRPACDAVPPLLLPLLLLLLLLVLLVLLL